MTEMKNLPEKIYLSINSSGVEPGEDVNDFENYDDEFIFWSADRIEPTDPEYVLVTKHTAPQPNWDEVENLMRSHEVEESRDYHAGYNMAINDLIKAIKNKYGNK